MYNGESFKIFRNFDKLILMIYNRVVLFGTRSDKIFNFSLIRRKMKEILFETMNCIRKKNLILPLCLSTGNEFE